jgi:hypothetical protein
VTGLSPSTSVSPVSGIPPLLHTHIYLHVAATRRTRGRKLGTSPQKKEYSSEKREDLIRKVLPDILIVTINLDKVCLAKYAVKRFVQLL